MENPRRHGRPPYRVAVIHGGPGAPGEVAPVARELARKRGVLEPLQTAASLEGQVDELLALVAAHGEPPFVLIGHSWGAWLAYLAAARIRVPLSKIILVGSGPFEASYAASIRATRRARLSGPERERLAGLEALLADPEPSGRSQALAEFGALLSRADAYDPLPQTDASVAVDAGIHESVWREGAALRRSGELLARGESITCPVVAIHGSYDPHPAEGVREPLSRIVTDFRFVALDKCGHSPWIERHAREAFFESLERELAILEQ